MPDISMCDAEDCPLALTCYRSPQSGTQPSEQRQAWGHFQFTADDGCDGYWSVGDFDGEDGGMTLCAGPKDNAHEGKDKS